MITSNTLIIKLGTNYCVHLFERYEDPVLLKHCKDLRVTVFDFFVDSMKGWGAANASDLTEEDVTLIINANTCYAENKDKPGFHYSRWAGDRVVMVDMDAKTCGWWNSKTNTWIYYD